MKITELEIRGVQSHKKTKLALSPGVNVFIGESDRGKSSIIKSINWLAFNRPTQFGDMARDNAKQSLVKLVTDEELSAIRSKTKSKNEYQLGDDVFHNVGTNVPQEIREALNLEDMNFRGQFDPIFFLTMTPGERTRYLNDKVADLWLIDTFISEFNKEIKDCTNNENWCAEEAAGIEESVKELDWVPELQERVYDLNRRVGLHEDTAAVLTVHRRDLSKVLKLQREMPNRDKIRRLQNAAADLDKTRSTLKEHGDKLEGLRADHDEAVRLSKDISRYRRYSSRRRKKLDKLAQKADKIENKRDELERIRDRVTAARKCQRNLDKLKEEVKRLREQYQEEFPDVCPWCGADWSENEK